MEKITPAESFQARAQEAIASANDSLRDKHFETAISRAYYACYYAIHSKLEEMGEKAGSHKQTGILFRKYFIKEDKLEQKYSIILRELSEWRMDADYAPYPEINEEKAVELVKKASEFVEVLFSI